MCKHERETKKEGKNSCNVVFAVFGGGIQKGLHVIVVAVVQCTSTRLKGNNSKDEEET